MKKCVVFLADGFEEIEALATVDLLRRANINVTVAGVTGAECVGAHNIKVAADVDVSTVNTESFDAFVCPGGGVGAENLRNSHTVKTLVKNAFENGKLVAAICAAPTVLEEAGIMKGKKSTIYPAMKDCLKDAQYLNCHVVQDGNIITGAGPAATFPFAFAIIEYLADKETSDKVAADTLFSSAQ